MRCPSRFVLAESFPELPERDVFVRARGEASLIIEVEVDTLDQFMDALAAKPDIILLDNMTLDQMRECVQRRNQANASTELEASGGINFQNVRAVAETGVERISLGALTHSAVSLDVALDWDQQV